MAHRVDERVDAYIDALPDWQQAICREVRELLHEADPEMVETIKRTVQPYFVLQGNVAALLAAKDHVTVFLYDGGLAPDPEGIITGGPGEGAGPPVLDPARGADQPARDARAVPGHRRRQP